MLDTLRLVSSEDVGRDEANVQSLLKKHKDATEELKNYGSTIEALHSQAEGLGERDRQSAEVQQRLSSIDARYLPTFSLISYKIPGVLRKLIILFHTLILNTLKSHFILTRLIFYL
jgi:spectrin beta